MILDDAIDSVKKFFASLVFVPPSEFLHFAKLVSFQIVKKGEHLYVTGEKFNKIGFVVKGLMYNYYTRDDKTTIANYFIKDGMPATCYADLLQNIPASFSCKAIEDTYLITIQYEDFQKLFLRHHCWDRIARLSAEKLYIEKEIREMEFLLMPAEKRYENFVKNYPQLINRVPQQLIATYLGIRPESLSRIRSQR